MTVHCREAPPLGGELRTCPSVSVTILSIGEKLKVGKPFNPPVDTLCEKFIMFLSSTGFFKTLDIYGPFQD